MSGQRLTEIDGYDEHFSGTEGTRFLLPADPTEEAIEKLLSTERVKFYVGFDPTGNSLHVGHLLPVMAMRLMQKAGHIPIVLVGGATARIGDPSGKKSARPMMTLETIAENVACLRSSFRVSSEPRTAKRIS